jgi:S-adenosylmethionine-dependent methyltransferase
VDDLMAKWDAGAPAYATYMTSPAGRFRATLIWDTLQRHLPPSPLHVLELGCGLGDLACALAARGDRVVAAEPSREMLCQAEKRAEALPCDARSRLDLLALDAVGVVDRFAPASFDCLVVHTVIEYLPDPSAVFARLATLLAPGGLASLVQINHASKVLRASLIRHDFAAARAALDDPVVVADTFGLAAQAATPDSALGLLTANGLEILGFYGLRVFADYLPVDIRNDPTQAEALLQLERAVCDRDPYRAMGRYLHVVGRKR